MCFDVGSFHRASGVTSFRHVKAILLKDLSRKIFSGASVEFIRHDIVLALGNQQKISGIISGRKFSPNYFLDFFCWWIPLGTWGETIIRFRVNPGVRVRQFFTLPSFFSGITVIFGRFEFRTFFFNMVTGNEEALNHTKK